MTPKNSNFAGNVHGGNILQMIEEAGAIIAMAHCNDVPERVSNKSICACMYTHMYTHTHIHACMHTYIHKHTHT